MAEVVYNTGKEKITTNALPNAATNLRALLISVNKTGASDPDVATVAAIDALNSGATVLTTQRVTLASVTKTSGATLNTNDRVEWDCADFAFTGVASVSALALVIYDEGGGADATRIPIAYYDTGFGGGIDITGGLNVTIGANGFLWLS